MKLNELLIPKFYLVSSDPDRENTEDYLRNHFKQSEFYQDINNSSSNILNKINKSV